MDMSLDLEVRVVSGRPSGVKNGVISLQTKIPTFMSFDADLRCYRIQREREYIAKGTVVMDNQDYDVKLVKRHTPEPSHTAQDYL